MLDSLAQFRGMQGLLDGPKYYQQAFELAMKVGDTRQAALAAEGLGWTYRDVAGLKDLDLALQWFFQGLKIAPEEDVALRGKLMLMSGSIFVRWFEEAWDKPQRDIEKI